MSKKHQDLHNSTGSRRRFTASILLLFLMTLSAQVAVAEGPTTPNIVVIMTDDQRFDTLWAMPIANSVLFSRSVKFNNAYVTTPWCCPARSSFMSGGYYVHNTQTLTNGDPRFRDTDTIATRLWDAGYTTAMIGKYLNGYTNVAPYIPPAWDSFYGIASLQVTIDWLDFEVGVGSTGATSDIGTIVSVQEYITDYEAARAIEFIENVGSQPFYLYLSFSAMHAPNTPEPEDAALFSDFEYSGRAYNEADLSDKPSWVQENGTCVPPVDSEPHRNALRSIQSVDRAIGEIVTTIESLGKLDNTVFIFTSDHGTMWGEHRICNKGHPYEEALKVPFLVAMPGVAAAEVDHMISANLDLGPTVFDLAGVVAPSDGASLMTFLSAPGKKEVDPVLMREHLLLQTFKEPIWSGLLVDRADGKWKFVERTTGEFELYDLVNDPFELENIANDPVNTALVTELSMTLNSERGLSLAFHKIPTAIVGHPYEFQPRAWGGSPPYTWRVALPTVLPEGLNIDPGTGLISGTPTTEGCALLTVKITASSLASHWQQLEDTKLAYEFCRVLDTDGDSVIDATDNCTAIANVDQRDSNSDGIGNACDADIDNNCVVNFLDYALVPAAFNSTAGDPNFDDDIDFDGDGNINFMDVVLFQTSIFGPPGPSANPCVVSEK